jgi:hypothetical protein
MGAASISTGTCAATPPTSFARAVLRAINWRMVLLTQSIGVLVALARSLQQRTADVAMLNHVQGQAGFTPFHFLNSHFIVTGVGALCVLLAALAAEEAMRRGARLLPAFAAALAAASIATAILQWCVRACLHLDYAPAAAVPLVRLALVALDTALLGGLALLAYLNRQSAERMLQGVRTAELDRIHAERRLIDARLASARAQIDPGSLLQQLAAIRDLYRATRADADAQLETLIQQLRGRVTNSCAIGGEMRTGRP